MADLFPTVVDTARNFVENNGFKAHRRRQEETGTCGSSLPQIKQHLFHIVPNLQEERPSLGKTLLAQEPGRPQVLSKLELNI